MAAIIVIMTKLRAIDDTAIVIMELTITTNDNNDNNKKKIK